jgi:hypothetical protein
VAVNRELILLLLLLVVCYGLIILICSTSGQSVSLALLLLAGYKNIGLFLPTFFGKGVVVHDVIFYCGIGFRFEEFGPKTSPQNSYDICCSPPPPTLFPLFHGNVLPDSFGLDLYREKA